MQNQFKGQITVKMTFRLKIGEFLMKLWEIKVFEKMLRGMYGKLDYKWLSIEKLSNFLVIKI